MIRKRDFRTTARTRLARAVSRALPTEDRPGSDYSEAEQALARTEGGEHIGKIVLRVL